MRARQAHRARSSVLARLQQCVDGVESDVLGEVLSNCDGDEAAALRAIQELFPSAARAESIQRRLAQIQEERAAEHDPKVPRPPPARHAVGDAAVGAAASSQSEPGTAHLGSEGWCQSLVASTYADSSVVSFNLPSCLCVTRDLTRMFISDCLNHCIRVLDYQSRLPVTSLGARGDGPRQLYAPMGMALSRDNKRIIICDCNNNRVLVWGMDGEPVHELRDGLSSPYSVAVDYAERIYVADKGNNRLVIYDSDGGRVQRTLECGFLRPKGLAISEDGLLFVVDSGHHRVCVFESYESDLQLIRHFPCGVDPREIALDRYERVLVSIVSKKMVGVFDFNGNALGCIGQRADATGEFGYPYGVEVVYEPGATRYLVADRKQGIIKSFSYISWSEEAHSQFPKKFRDRVFVMFCINRFWMGSPLAALPYELISAIVLQMSRDAFEGGE